MQSDEVFLEAQVQNVTNGVLSLEKVLLEPSQLFGVTSLNAVQEEDETGNAETRLDNVLYKLKWDKKILEKNDNINCIYFSDRSSERSTLCSHKILGNTSSVLHLSLRSNLITSS